MTSTTSRLTLVADIAPTPASAGSATIASADADPIFAAIETHRAAWAEFNSKCSDLDAEGTPEAKAEEDRLSDAETDALFNLAKIMPTSLAGMTALSRHVAEYERLRCGDGRSSNDTDDGEEKSWSFLIHNNMANALEIISGTVQS